MILALALPPYLDEWEYHNIMERMLERIPDNIDKSEGSFLWDQLSILALEFERAASEMAIDMLERSFVQTAYGVYLDLRAEEMGLSRRPAIAATGSVVFTGESGTVVPNGTQVSTVSPEEGTGVAFATTQEVVIPGDGYVEVEVEAIEPGSSGNVAADTVTVMMDAVEGISSVTNPEPMSGGLDEEGDDTLRDRVAENAQRRDGDGNTADYIAWAKSVPGVGNVLVDPLWRGPGTVRLVILDQDGNVPSQQIVDAVQEYLDPDAKGIGEGKAPIGHKVTVQGPRIRRLRVIVPGLVAETGYSLEQAQDNVRQTVLDTFIEASPGSVIRIRDVSANIIQSPGVLDIGDILIDGKRDNVSLDIDEKADVDEVVFT